MTAGNNINDGLTCRRCSFRNQAGDQFCGSCGAPIVLPPPMPPPNSLVYGPPAGGSVGPAPGFPVAQRDATTRYLCAAAHLDPDYSDAAIAEFLVEPVRAIPPAPGVDSAAVLRDAVAARARRRIRDAVLLLLLVVLGVVSLPALVVWVVLAAAMSPFYGAGTGRRRSRVITLLLLAGIVLLGIFLLPLFALLVKLILGGLLPDIPSLVPGLLPVVLLSLVAVIGVDAFTVHYLVYTNFRPGRFVPDGRQVGGWERTVRTLGHASFQAALARVAAADERGTQNRDQADIVVHRGFSPFIGAGKPLFRKIIALPLEPAKMEDKADKEDEGSNCSRPQRISVMELQQCVAAAINELRSSSSLSPGHRFEGLIQREQVLIAADRLVTNLGMQPQPAVLPDLYHAPAAHMQTSAARHLADTPPEWARYYRCFRIEAWDRDLTTSCYLHAGTDQRMLFLEWTFCVLPPIRESYRHIDRYQDPFVTPLVRSLLELVVLPATVIRRFQSVFRQFKPLVQRDGEVVPDRYGAGKSLRELAAASDVQSYFQDVDVERYVKILHSKLGRAVGQYLEDHHCSVIEFMKQADPAVNFNNIYGGTFIQSAVGSGNTSRGNVFRGNVYQSAPSEGKP